MKNWSPQQKKAVLVLTLVLVLALVCLLGLRPTDAFSHRIRGMDFLLSEDAERTINENYGVVYLEPDGFWAQTLQMAACDIKLEPGTYSIEVQYTAKDLPAQLQVFAADYLKEDGTCGSILLQVDLETTAEAYFGTFSLDQSVNNLQCYIFVPQGCTFAVARVDITSDTVMSADILLFIALLVLGWAVMLWLILSGRELTASMELGGKRVSSRRVSVALAVVFCGTSLLAMTPLLGDVLPHAVDLPFHLARIESLKDGLAAGQFPVRVHPYLMNGRGYLNSVFYPELLLYLPALLRLLGMSLYNSYRVFIFFSNFLTVFLAYISFVKLFRSRNAALMSAVAYLFSAYRLASLHDRAAVGEFTAMIFFPVVLYGLYAVIWKEEKDWPWLTLGISGVFQTHILSTEVVLVLCAVAAVLGLKRIFGKEKRIVPLLKAAAMMVAINLWFIVPFVLMSLQQGMDVFSRRPQLAASAVSELRELFSLSHLVERRAYEYGLAPSGIGWVLLINVGALVLYSILRGGSNDEDRQTEKLGAALAVTGGFCVLGSTWLFPWEYIQRIPVFGSLVGAMQFPYRLLTISMFCFSALCGVNLVLWCRTSERKKACMVAGCLLAILPAMLWMEPISAQLTGEAGTKSMTPTYFSQQIAVGQAEYVPANSDRVIMMGTPPSLLPLDDSIQLYNVQRNGTTFEFAYVCEEQGDHSVRLPVTYYPGYSVKVNGRPTAAMVGEGNFVQVELTGTEGYVEVAYTSPTSYRLAELISLAALVGWGLVPQFSHLCRRKRVKV